MGSPNPKDYFPYNHSTKLDQPTKPWWMNCVVELRLQRGKEALVRRSFNDGERGFRHLTYEPMAFPEESPSPARLRARCRPDG